MRHFRTALIAFSLSILTCSPMFARGKLQGYCEKGGVTLATSGMSATPKVQGSYPSCTVRVFLAGTANYASIFEDNAGTVKANPFTASNTGLWFFYADNGRYDVQLSGTVNPAFTIGDLTLTDVTGALSAPTGVAVGNGTTLSGVVAASPLQQLRRKPNVTTTTYEFVAPVSNLASDYSFPAQTPAAALTAGVDATITFTPCSLGLNWNNPAGSNSLYITDAVGGNETVTIKPTGPGTATSGASTGTLTLTGITLNHTAGNWTIASATGGVQEAVCALPAAGGEVVISASTMLYANVGWCGKTTGSVRKMPGVVVGGAFTVLGSSINYAGNDAWVGGISYAPYIDQALGMGGMTIYPTFTSAGNTSLAYALQIQQSDPTKITSSDFFNGIGVDLHVNTPKWYVEGLTPNQVAGIMAFTHSYKGADVFGADLHAFVPASATVAPNYVIGAQISIDLHADLPGYGQRIGAFITSASSTTPKVSGTVGVLFGGDAGFSQLITNFKEAFSNEGIILQPNDDVSNDKRAYALLNAAGTITRWYVDVAGREVATSLRVGGPGVVSQVTGSGAVHFTGNTARIFDTYRTPATSAETGFAGELAFSATHLYLCAGDNVWKRLTLEAF